MTDSSKRMIEARNSLILGQPFFGVLSLSLELVESNEVDLAATNGKVLKYNPVEIDKLPFDQVVTIIVHEVMHNALGHHTRRNGRDAARWNRSCDYTINPMLLDAGFAPIPGWLLRDDYRKMSAEEVYTRETQEDQHRTPDEINELDNAAERLGTVTDGVNDSKGTDDASGDDGSPATSAELATQEQEWSVRVMQAAAAAKANGQLSGAAQWLVDQIKKPKINWREVLRDFVASRANNESSWTRPNRRYINQGIYLPSAYSRKIGDIVVMIDCSGSCWGPTLDAFCSELNGILEDMEPERTHVLLWDAELQGHTEYDSNDLPIKIKPTGGGGTVFDGVWPYIESAGITPDCVVCLTDLYCSFGVAPDYPVLWCSTDSMKAPFGDVVKLTL